MGRWFDAFVELFSEPQIELDGSCVVARGVDCSVAALVELVAHRVQPRQGIHVPACARECRDRRSQQQQDVGKTPAARAKQGNHPYRKRDHGGRGRDQQTLIGMADRRAKASSRRSTGGQKHELQRGDEGQ